MDSIKWAASFLAALLLLVSGTANARFVSVDPVQANANNGQNFNRYNYGLNNPYKFKDLDGRCIDGVTCEAMGQSFAKNPEAVKPLVPFAIAGVAIMAAPLVPAMATEGGMYMLSNPGVVATATDIAAGAAGVTGTASAWSALRPGGQAIGQAGNSSNIRIMEGGLKEATAMFKQLTNGGTVITGSTYKGTLVSVGEDALIGLRQTSTRGSQPPTIDVMGNTWKGLGVREIKFVKEIPK